MDFLSGGLPMFSLPDQDLSSSETRGLADTPKLEPNDASAGIVGTGGDGK
jgi:hypothetical protein